MRGKERPTRRSAKPAKAKVEAKLFVSRKAPKSGTARVRDLEKSLAEALEQQTATSEILRVISSSPTDGQPVFDVIVESACRLCDAVFANAVQFDGELMHNMAHYGFSPEGRDILMRAFPRAPTRESMSGRAILEGAVVQSEDMSTDEGTALSHQLSRVLGSHAYLSVPMLREGVPVGAITVARRERGSFPARQVELLNVKGFLAAVEQLLERHRG